MKYPRRTNTKYTKIHSSVYLHVGEKVQTNVDTYMSKCYRVIATLNKDILKWRIIRRWCIEKLRVWVITCFAVLWSRNAQMSHSA